MLLTLPSLSPAAFAGSLALTTCAVLLVAANIVRRWLNEAQTALQSSSEMVQYHALTLLYQLKQHDRLGVQKLVTQLSKAGSLRSPLAVISLIRYTSKLMHDEARETAGGVADGSSELARAGYRWVEIAHTRHLSGT